MLQRPIIQREVAELGQVFKKYSGICNNGSKVVDVRQNFWLISSGASLIVLTALRIDINSKDMPVGSFV